MFLIRPKAIFGESLSSWRQRCGLVNGFRLFPNPEQRSWNRDPDFLPGQPETAWLEEEFGLPAGLILSLTLNSFHHRVFGNSFRGFAGHWILSLGNSGKGALTGPSCCPICMREDLIPHFRLSWRFAFLTYCPIHQCQLLDRCPQCNALIWPAMIRRRIQANSAWIGLEYCAFCEQALPSAKVVIDGHASVSTQLYAAAQSGESPAPQAANAPEYFAGLWALCQLLLRRGGKRVWSHIPKEYGGGDLCASEIGGSTIERLPINARANTIEAATWLTTEWPERFVKVACDSGLSAEQFSGRYYQLPPWLATIVRKHLAQRNHSVTGNQVQSAIDSCVAHGMPASKRSVRRLLGVSQSKAIDQVLSQRRHATSSECLQLISVFELAIAKAPTARDEQATLARDYLIFLVSVLIAETVEAVCHLNQPTIDMRLEVLARGNALVKIDAGVLVERARELQALYARGIRQRFLSGSEENSPWFISRFGKPLHGHHFRQRIAMLMADKFDTKLWRSADVFVGSLFPIKL